MPNFCKIFQIDEMNQALVIVGHEGCGAAGCQCKRLVVEIRTRIKHYDLSVDKVFETVDDMEEFFDNLTIESVRDAWKFMCETALKYERMINGNTEEYEE